MCCGHGADKRIVRRLGTKLPDGSSTIPMENGEVAVRYIGDSRKVETFYGSVTGAQYRASFESPVIIVDKKDAQTKNAQKPGLLEMQVSGKNVFVAIPE